jgi:signal peptidase I
MAAGARTRAVVAISVSLFCMGICGFGVGAVMYKPFLIHADSMAPTLRGGDYVVANTTSEWTIGDIIVFEYPKDPKVTYVKRIIGLPGDTIKIRDHQPIRNGKQVRHGPEQVVSMKESSPCVTSTRRQAVEHLGRQPYPVWRAQKSGRSPVANMAPTVVPAGHLFVMGDQRDESMDSRSWGFVPTENVVGRVSRILFHFDAYGDRPLFSRWGIIG